MQTAHDIFSIVNDTKMTNVTKKKIRTDIFIKARSELVKSLRNDKKFANRFINELLTESEQIMLIKRFAAIVMYQKGYSQYRVWNALFISPATAQRIYEQFARSNFYKTAKTYEDEGPTGFLGLIADLINAQVNMKARRRLTERF